ncbi:hypothetical protein L6164_015587 [Bauhinia variegata]|uniref:Uncharacterized protein n=1 Tax=Bauhinia variegata TaxID=167791 RepID=A0ACB9NKQ7_BAUVA|nr:hypothetical protein L6164_015587 [Bauhinia variegata]
MEETPGPEEGNIVGDLTGKLHEILTESDTETGQFFFEERMIEEVMQELYKEITYSSITGPASFPGTLLPSSSLPASPVLIDKGKNESCGASVSDSASTVMAGISIAGVLPETAKGGSDESVGFGVGLETKEEKMEGCDGGDLDDEWLGRVLSWVQLESRQWF